MSVIERVYFQNSGIKIYNVEINRQYRGCIFKIVEYLRFKYLRSPEQIMNISVTE